MSNIIILLVIFDYNLIQPMMKKLIAIVFISCLAFVACDNSSNNFNSNSNVSAVPESAIVEQTYQKILYIIGSSFNSASCNVGYTSGVCKMYLGSQQGSANPFFANVAYSVFMPIQGYTEGQNEDGVLSNFRWGSGDHYGAKSISADWTPKGSGSGTFKVTLIKNNAGEIVLLISIKGSGWEYYDNVQLNDKMLNRIVELLQGDVNLIPKAVADTTNQVDSLVDGYSDEFNQDESFYVVPISVYDDYEACVNQFSEEQELHESIGMLNLSEFHSFDKKSGYMIYYGPFNTQEDCVNFLKGLAVSKKGVYGLLASQERKRVQVSPNGTVTERILE